MDLSWWFQLIFSIYRQIIQVFCDAPFHGFICLHWFLFCDAASLWFGKDKGSIMESAESGGTIYLDLHRMDTLVTIR